jgi:hypothetical protein
MVENRSTFNIHNLANYDMTKTNKQLHISYPSEHAPPCRMEQWSRDRNAGLDRGSYTTRTTKYTRQQNRYPSENEPPCRMEQWSMLPTLLRARPLTNTYPPIRDYPILFGAGEYHVGGSVCHHIDGLVKFRLNGQSFIHDTFQDLEDAVFDSLTFYQGNARFRLSEQGFDYAMQWGNHVVPRPYIDEHIQLLIDEEAKLVRDQHFVQESLNFDMIQVVAMEHIEEDEENDIPQPYGPDTYSYAMGLARGRMWIKMQYATLSGFLKPEDLHLPDDDIKERLGSFLWAQFSKLMTYQLVIRTLLRVKKRCKHYKAVAPMELMLGQYKHSGINALVCAYLGDVAMPTWYDQDYSDMWSARVTASGREHDYEPEDLLPMSLNIRLDRYIYVKTSPQYWDMPWY